MSIKGRVFWIIPIAICTLDQLTKFIVQRLMVEGQSVTILGDFFRISYFCNVNGAFGLPIQNILSSVPPKLFFCFFMGIAIAVLVSLYRKTRDHESLLRLALAVILGGALGNFIDRVLMGRVVDFLDFDFLNIHVRPFKVLFIRFPGYYMDRWPTFNVADMAITCGITLLLITTFFRIQKERHIKTDEK
jgi:signal peptidase II